MKYYNYEQREKMLQNAQNKKLNDILEKYFGDNKKWGANVLFNEQGNADTIELCKLLDVTQKGETWEHYATIGLYQSNDENNKNYWELYSQFNGKKENELWVLAYYKDFGNAARRIFLGIEKMKPLKVY